MNDTDNILLLFIQIAVDLANSIHEDIKTKGYVSETTLKLLRDFRQTHNQLNDQLEAKSGLH